MPTNNQDFYHSKEWRAFRARMVAELDHFCVECGKEVFGADITVDHILPASRYPELALEPTNVQIMCRICNGRKQDAISVRQNFFNQNYIKSMKQ